MQNVVETKKLITQSKADTMSFDLDVCAIGDGVKRAEIEAFIKAGYKKSFNADISVTMPNLLYIEDNALKAALGMRGFDQEFFIQQYLDLPVTDYLQIENEKVKAEQLVEIGSLYSNSNRFTIPLFMVTAVTSFLLGKHFLLLCGTEHVLDLLAKSDVAYQKLANADATKLTNKSDDWGSYYLTNPQVVAVNLNNVMKVIANNRFYHKLLHRLSDKIDNACSKMAGKL